mgnify:FL=1|jgi:hypothetical protein
MPQLDGTGPKGKGPLTGRGAGKCQKDSCIYYGFARGRGLRYRQLQSMKDSKQNLQEIKSQLESEIKLVNEKIENTDK